jgi:branched-chain amino acid transport system substrate-binding protein
VNYLKYLFPSLIIFLVALFFIDKEYLQSYNYKELKLEREKLSMNVTKNDPIIIGAVWSFAEAELVGDNFKEGIEFAVDEINSNGGILERQIEIIFKDDELDIDKSVAIAKEFASNPNITATISHFDSSLAIYSSITYDYSGILMISPGATDPLFTRDDFKYIFRTVPNDIDMGNAIAKVTKMKNFNKIAVLYEKSVYAETIAKVLIERALELGLDVVYKENFAKDENFFTEITTNLSPITNYSIDYDVIAAIGTDKNIPLLIEKAREKGIYSPFITTDNLDLKSVLNNNPSLNNTIVATIFNSEALTIKTQNFIEKFKKKYNFYPDTWASQGYDAVMLLAEAIKRTKSTNPTDIAKNLKYIKNFDSIFGKYSMTPRGDIQGRDIYFKIIENGKFKYLNFD